MTLIFPVVTLAGEMRLIGAPMISPDGKTVVFEWLSDLWQAPATGGEAVRVEANPGHDGFPRFTPDGKRIVFSSDRTGSQQVFSIPTGGGSATQHTFHSEGNELECLSPDGTRAIVRGTRDRYGFRQTQLLEISLTRDEREQRLFDAAATSADTSPDGKRILFCRGGEQLYRKGYKGSRASQIWRYDRVSQTFTSLIAEDTDARSPVWLPDGKGFYFLSSRSGTGNVWVKSADSATPRPLTHFSGDGVNSISLSADGAAMVFRRGLEVFHFAPKSKQPPRAVTFWTKAGLPDVSRDVRSLEKAVKSDFTAGMDQVVFSAAGELWWLKTAGETAVQVTHTPVAEENPRFSPDGKWLYFSRDNGLEVNFHRCQFDQGKLLNEEQLTRSKRSKGSLKISPDDSRIAWTEGTGDLFAAAADGAEQRLVMKGWEQPTFDWSPCGRWLAIAAVNRNAGRDIWLTRADGRGNAVNLTQHPAFEGSPRWSPDGRWLAFSARRDADQTLQLWVVDLGKTGLSTEVTDEAIVELGAKARRISTGGIEPERMIWTADSKFLLFQNKDRSDEHLHSVAIFDHALTRLTAQRGVPIRTTRDGALLWQVDHTPAIFKNGANRIFPIKATVDHPREAVLTLAFRRVWRTLGERYYDPSMSGRDWAGLRLKYEPFAAGARSSRQFDHVISQLYGELNASHLSFLRKPWSTESSAKAKSEEVTAHPGLIFQDRGREGPLVIDRVVDGSKVALLPQAPRPGETVVKIAGENVTRRTPLHRFFNGAENRALPITVRASDGSERVLELRCISYEKARMLDRDERESTARRIASQTAKVSYLAVPDMNRDTIDGLEQKVYQCSLSSEGLILDLRNNGGGREADRLLAMFCQPVHSFTMPRNGPDGYPQARRLQTFWPKPLVVICNQNTYSNSEIFCHAIQQADRAPLVGVTTAGGVISAVKTTIPDAGTLQIPFRGWFRVTDGSNLELNGAKPDFPVPLSPADEDARRDPQLKKALEILKSAMARTPSPPAPRWRPGGSGSGR